MLRSLIRYPYQLCSCLVIAKMVEQAPISHLDLFQHLWVRHKACGINHQLGSASVQTVDHGGQAMTFSSLWWAAASWRVPLLNYITLLHFCFFLNVDCFSVVFFSSSLSIIFCVLLFIDSLLFGLLASYIMQRPLYRYETDVSTYFSR